MAALFQYQKLKPEEGPDFIEDHEHHCKTRFRPILQRSSSRVWAKLRTVHVRRRLRLRVPRLRRFLMQKTRLVAAAVREAVRRLKKGQEHLGDLLIGNYLFLQVSPYTPATMQKCTIKRCTLHRGSLPLRNLQDKWLNEKRKETCQSVLFDMKERRT